MAGVSADLLSDDLYRDMIRNQLWQNQLGSGLNIANAGWKTALGLALGTGLGNWLGDNFWNAQKAKRDEYKYGLKNNPAAQAAVNNLLGGDVDLGWTPQYQFKTPQEYFLDAVKYNPNWRNAAYNNALPKYQSAMTGFLPPKPQPAIAPVANTTLQPATANPSTSPSDVVIFDFTDKSSPTLSYTPLTSVQNPSWDWRNAHNKVLQPQGW